MNIYTCLFATDGVDLLTPMRQGASDDEMKLMISNIWNHRKDRYSEERADMTVVDRKKVEMFHIGG